MAGPARVRRRHRGLMLSLVILVIAPVLVSTVYLWGVARDQYASTAGFTVRQEETGGASQILGGLSQLVGASVAGNSDLLFEFIQSQAIVEALDDRLDLIGHYSENWPQDPVFSIRPTATIEDLHWFWRRMVRISFDRASGLIMIEARAGDAQTARTIAEAIISESEQMINLLNATARRDSMANAQRDLQEALARLRASREALTEYRARTQIMDPSADIQGRLGVLNNLQQQLAQALVDYDLLLLTADTSDPRVRNAQRRVTVIRERILEERRSVSEQDVTIDDTDFPRLLAQFESLLVDQEFAQENYGAALTALELARSNAERQQLYLATFVRPTIAQRPSYPKRVQLVFLTAFFALMVWAILALVYYSLRDRG